MIQEIYPSVVVGLLSWDQGQCRSPSIGPLGGIVEIVKRNDSSGDENENVLVWSFGCCKRRLGSDAGRRTPFRK
jgi:hypothetical protein